MKILKIISNKFKGQKLPEHFEQNEKIARTIFSPINLNNNKTKIKSNAFKPKVGTDGISVNRLSYTTIDFIKKLGKEMTNPDKDRKYFGFGILRYYEIIECNVNVEYTPSNTNKFHADIKIGFIPKRGVPLPSEYSQKIKRLAEKAKLYMDPTPDSDKWEGAIIE